MQVYDLLRPKDQDLPIREDQEKNIFIPNLAKVACVPFNNIAHSNISHIQLPVTSYEQFLETYDLGCKNRTTAPTALNSSSSRSHAVLIITVSLNKPLPPPTFYFNLLLTSTFYSSPPSSSGEAFGYRGGQTKEADWQIASHRFGGK